VLPRSRIARASALFCGLLILGLLALLAWQRLFGESGGPLGSSQSSVIRAEFQLTDQFGERRDNNQFRGRFMLVFFGFTHCPDFCPTALYSISLAMDRLGARAETLVPVFITLDPERDTPAQLKAYAQNFDKRVVMLTGGAAEIAAVAKAYRVYYAKKPLEKPGDYTIDHSAYIYLMGPNGKFLTHFRHAIAPDDLAKALQRHL
jgi:protein SCO1/2